MFTIDYPLAACGKASAAGHAPCLLTWQAVVNHGATGLGNARYVFTTGLILWCLVFATSFNLLVMYETLKYIWTIGALTSLCSILIVSVLVLSTLLLVKARSRPLLVLSWFTLGLCCAITWLLAVKWNVVNYDSLTKMIAFTLVLATVFVLVSIPVSTLIHRKLRKTAEDYIQEALKGR